MFANRRIQSLAALSILVAMSLSMDAGERPRSSKKRITAEECERLVKQLVNPNKPPFKEHYAFPWELDYGKIRKQQEKIREAYDRLSDNFEVSLPILVKHVDDDRFSYVYEDVGTSGVVVKASVGKACNRIIKAHVEVYRREVTRPDFAFIPRCPNFIIDECGGVKKWWKSRKNKTLAELQLEGIEWARRLKKPRLFESDKEWDKAKKALRKMTADIRTSNKPIKVEDHLPPPWSR